MKNIIYLIVLSFVFNINSQKINYELYTLDNDLDVILHQENTAPVVTVAVMYHVGAKDEIDGRTGFAHFFEHLLFNGTKNIGKGEWDNILEGVGARNNANTSHDRTYYYEVLPSNHLELALWMESERMLHPVIDQLGVETQNEVVKEEKRQRIDNAAYGALFYGTAVDPHLYKKHPYRRSVIGSMEDLDAATLDEFKSFNKKWNNPNNATLVIAGDFRMEETKKMIKDYFNEIPNYSEKIKRTKIEEPPITNTIKLTEYDDKIQIPVKALIYRIPGFKDRDTYVLQYISRILSSGKSSRLVKRMVDEEKLALRVFAINQPQEEYGKFSIAAFPIGDTNLATLKNVMDEEIDKLKTNLISEREYEKVKNQFEISFIQSNNRIEGIASSLATYHTLYDNIELINEEIKIYRSITKEEIRDVANKYLNDNQRIEMNYLPKNSDKK